MLSEQLQLLPAVIPKPLEKFLLSDQDSEYISLKFCSSGQPLFVTTNRSLDNQESKSYGNRQDREGGVCPPPFIFPATPTPGESVATAQPSSKERTPKQEGEKDLRTNWPAICLCVLSPSATFLFKFSLIEAQPKDFQGYNIFSSAPQQSCPHGSGMIVL